MRDMPDVPLSPWDPPSYRVDGDGKVVGAEPGDPNNWGRWGPDDQRGTANLCTPERVAAAARLVRTGRRFALGLPIGRGAPAPGYRSPPLHLHGITTGDAVLGASRAGADMEVSDDYVVMALQATTQLDGLSHVGSGHTLYNGFWSGLVSSAMGARRLGVHKVADGICGRGVLLDLARHAGVDRLAPGHAVGPEELDAAAAAQGVEVRPGDILLVRTGHLGWWLGEGPAAGHDEPGLSSRAIPWLHAHDVAMVATDTGACEPVPSEPDHPFLEFHVRALRDLGLHLGELFELDELADDCAADGTYEVLYVLSPLPVVGGSGSPVNPIALK